MQDLKDVTNNVHYENYRYKKLALVGGDKAKLPNNKWVEFQHVHYLTNLWGRKDTNCLNSLIVIHIQPCLYLS